MIILPELCIKVKSYKCTMSNANKCGNVLLNRKHKQEIKT